MAQLQRIEGQIELKCNADKFFEIWAHKPYLISKMCANRYPKIELNKGECWNRVGAMFTWYYVIDEIGEQAIVKTGIEECNEEDRIVRYSYHGGHVVENYYKTIKSKIQAFPKGDCEKGCIVKWSIEYEKMNDNVPEPNIYIDYLLGTAKDIDDCLCNA